MPPGVGDPNPMQQPCFPHFHLSGIAGVIVVVALQMQGAMDDQMQQVVSQAFLRRGGFPPDDTEGQDHFGLRQFVGQDVRGFVAAAVAPVERADESVIGQHDRRGDTRDCGRTCDKRAKSRHETVPGWVHHDDPKSVVGPLIRGGPPTVRFHYPCRGLRPVTCC